MITAVLGFTFIIAVYLDDDDEEYSSSFEGFINGFHTYYVLNIFVTTCLFYDHGELWGITVSHKSSYIAAAIACGFHLIALLRRGYYTWRVYNAQYLLAATSNRSTNLNDATYSSSDHRDWVCESCGSILLCLLAFILQCAALAGAAIELNELFHPAAGDYAPTGYKVALLVFIILTGMMLINVFISFCGCFGIHHAYWYTAWPLYYSALFSIALCLVAWRAEYGYDGNSAHTVFVGLVSASVVSNLCFFGICMSLYDKAGNTSGYNLDWDHAAILSATDPDGDMTVEDILNAMDKKPPVSTGVLPSLVRQVSHTDVKLKHAQEELKKEKEKRKAEKLSLYRDLVEISMEDGVITAREEATMLKFRKENGITEEEHQAILKECGYVPEEDLDLDKREELKMKNAAAIRSYKQMLALAMADGVVSAQEAKLLEQERLNNGISEQVHDKILEELGYTREQFAEQKVAGEKDIVENIPTPAYWKVGEHKGAENVATFVECAETSDEYKMVASAFLSTTPNVTILSIHYIINPYLWRSYAFVLRNIARNISAARQQPFSLVSANEKLLWHGTHPKFIPTIASRGFRREFTTTMAYGKGVYFARDSRYSSSVAYAKVDTDGTQQMFFCRVAVGECAYGSTNTDAPEKPGQPGVHYETLVDNTGNPSIFVATSDFQAYPEFVIKFKTKTP